MLQEIGVTVGAHVKCMGKAEFSVTELDPNDKVVLQAVEHTSPVE